MFKKKNHFKEAEKISREIDKIVVKVEKSKLKNRNVRRIKSLSSIEKELATKIAKILASYCRDEDPDCVIYVRAALLKYRPIDVVRLIENALSENKSIIVELKKVLDEKDIEKARSLGGFCIFSKFFKKTSREDLK
ncbi:MAG: hypothetical protein GXO10_04655 [Crenarchaeota archaeon]|nr:hypothetical protein [Thermoproteota archaeon]